MHVQIINSLCSQYCSNSVRVGISFPAMTLEQGRFRLRKKWKHILSDLEPMEICDSLYQDEILSQDDLEIIHAERIIRKTRCQHLLFKIFLDNDPRTIKKFFDCLDGDHKHLCLGIHHQESHTSNDDDQDTPEAMKEGEMMELSLSITHVWEDVGILAGGLSLNDLDLIKTTTVNPSLRPMKMLQQWRANAAEKMPNVRHLSRDELNAVLEDIDCSDRV